jgi:hypothetical protein
MVKNILIIISIFTYSFKIYSQTLTVSNYDPVAGERFDYGVNGNFTLNVGTPGTKKLWDFSSITSSNDYESYTVLTNNNTTDFSEATFIKQNNMVSTCNNYLYYKSSTSGINYLGYECNTQQLIPSEPSIVMPFPFFLGLNSISSYTQNGYVTTQTLTADATGTLITNYATYTNTLRVYYKIVSVSPVLIIVEEGHKWYSPDTHTEIYKVRRVANNSTLHDPVAIFLEKSSNLTNLAKINFSEGVKNIYPSPVQNYLHIELMDGLKKEKLTFELIDSTGKERGTEVIKISNTKFELQMNGLDPGIYLLKIMNEDQLVIIKKIIKS